MKRKWKLLLIIMALLIAASVAYAADKYILPLEAGDEATVYCQADVMQFEQIDDLTFHFYCSESNERIRSVRPFSR